MDGWIKLHRKMIDSPIFSSEKGLKVWVWCLCRANHKTTETYIGMTKIILHPGQFIFGREKASQQLKMAESTVREWMRLLKLDNNIDIKTTNKYSIVTILNWNEYQENDSKNDNRMTAERQQIGQQNDTDKNVKNDKNASITPPPPKGGSPEPDLALAHTELVVRAATPLTRPVSLTNHTVAHYLIELFRDLNPDVGRLHKIKHEADAALKLYQAVSGNLTELENAVRALPEIAGDRYCPKEIKSINKPSLLLIHWALFCAQTRGRIEQREAIKKYSVTQL